MTFDRARQSAAEFARRNLNAGYADRERRGEFSRAAWRLCAEQGFFRLNVPKKYGGSGGDITRSVAALEGLSLGAEDGGLALTVAVQMAGAALLNDFGSERLKRKYLPDLCAGKRLAVQAITEENAGCDVSAIATSYRRARGGFLLNGSKTLITHASTADLVFVYAKPAGRKGGLSGFIVERGFSGFSSGAPAAKLGLRTALIGDLRLRDCLVPAGNLVGAEGAARNVLAAGLERLWLFLSAVSLGAMERQLGETVRHARTRKQFGRALGEFQAVSHRIADMKVRLEASRRLVRHAAEAKAAGRAGLDCAIAKLFTTEARVQSALDAMRIGGGRSYLTGHSAETELRDAVGGVLHSGVSEVLKNMIASWSGLG